MSPDKAAPWAIRLMSRVPTGSAATSGNFSQPLVASIYTADPAAHVFKGRIYIYVTHDIDVPPLSDIGPFKGCPGHGFAGRDYCVLSMDRIGGEVTVHPSVLDIDHVAWAARQLWAPDAAEKDGAYYLYFTARDHEGAFRIGVAVSYRPEGPFAALPQPMKGSYSIDPAVFTDNDGASYLYFGGIGPGQLDQIVDGRWDRSAQPADCLEPDAPAFSPRVARLNSDMLEFAEEPREVRILDPEGSPLQAGDHRRRFFESAWMHEHGGRYYLSYSTGDTHLIVYAIGENPYGPFIYQGIILPPVEGWTTHQSIIEVDGRHWLFYHDGQLSGESRLRNVKMTELVYEANGSIRTVDYRRTK